MIIGSLAFSYLRKGVHQELSLPLPPPPPPLSLSHKFYLFNLFINPIFNKWDKYGIANGDKRCCGGLFFADMDHVYYGLQQRSQLNLKNC